MRKYDNYIGIDPGTTTGIAIWNSKEKKFEYIYSGGILEVMKKLEVYAVFGKNLFVIENPNLRKWYGVNSKGKEQGAGSIKRDFSIWKEWFQIMDVEFIEVNPKDLRTKMDAKSFRNHTKWEERTNSHSRDAAMMVFGM